MNKAEDDPILNELQLVDKYIEKGEYAKAIKQVGDWDRKYPNDENLEFNKIGFLIDAGLGLKKVSAIKRAVVAGEEILKDKHFEARKDTLLYNLANGYSYLYRLQDYGKIASPESANLQISKKYLRAMLALENLSSDQKKKALVNYANDLDTLGRGVESIYAYDEALRLDPTFSMAIANKAKALRVFADVSGKYGAAIFIQSYQDIQSVIDNQDIMEIGGIAAKQGFEKELEYIASRFKDKEALTKELKHHPYDAKNLSEFENFYLDFCIKEKLFLNFHIHHTNCEAAITDPIFISMVTKIGDDTTFYNFAKYINQIKEDYAVARLLLVQSQYRHTDLDNISTRTSFVNALDYSQFNLYVGLLKSSFQGAFNILDKIAFFINDYYGLKLPQNGIYFTSVWQKDGKIRDEILNSENMSLYALYDIFQDFKAAEHKRIKEIRNALTHRRLVVFDSMMTDWDDKTDRQNIGYETMLEQTIKLMRLTKAAIIYLINFVTIEENRKRGKGFIPQIDADTSQLF